MYGIMTHDGHKVLCNRSGTNVYILKDWNRASMPAMRKASLDIDQLLQDIGSIGCRYDLIVFKFTEEQLEEMFVRKIQGY